MVVAVVLFGEGWEAILRGNSWFLSDEKSFPCYCTTDGKEGFLLLFICLT